MTVGNKSAMLKMLLALALAVTISSPSLAEQASRQVQQPYKCALLLDNNEAFMASFSYPSETQSSTKMAQHIKDNIETTVYDIDGKTPIMVKEWVECVAKDRDFKSSAAQEIEQNFAQ